MKILFVIVFLSLMYTNFFDCAFAEQQKTEMKQGQISKQEQKPAKKDEYLSNLLNKRTECRKSGDLVCSIKTLEDMYYTDKSYLGADDEQTVNLMILEYLTMDSIDKYDLSNDKTYLNKAFKYSKLAVENGTKYTSIVEVSMLSAYLKMREKTMLNSYGYLCSLDNDKCKQYEENIANALAKIAKAEEAKQLNKDIKILNILNALKQAFLIYLAY